MVNLIEQLNKLEQLDIIALNKSEPDLEYAFKHVFTQESVYNSLLISDRRQIHQRIGEVLERLFPQALDDGDIVLLLAHHA